MNFCDIFGLDQLNFRPTQGVHSVGASKSLFFALIKEGVVFVCVGGGCLVLILRNR